MRIVKRILGVCLIVVLASALSILTTGVVVNAYIQSVLASFDIKLGNSAPGLGGMMKSIIGMEDKAASTSTEITENTKGTTSSSEEQDKSSTSDTSSPKSEDAVDEKVPEDAVPAMGQASADSTASDQSESSLDQQLVMTPEALGDLKNNLPSDKKVNIFNILMSKLPQDEMQKISTAMEDGLTEDEVKELQQVIAKYVDPEEYDTIMKMLTPTSEESP
ncbi:hypothetical protein H1230_01525 [Paenibacillus sp. 19GGS1-52]|uniref:hypothetical protein n=1 Tax=Paenibacillus sp. 19GGS1-52 TaxID=2758563 RepID=UPI001EFA5CFC|nr:hypothetical protein [Paenibacillus sp. 19GGS1-52]ULO07590.1 hypothetical protein H1230_01525 [Paenibacillus sp. 19GGS1-52]